MNSSKCILVVAGEPNSVFIELYIKSLKKVKVKNPLILIASYKLLRLQMKKLNLKKKIKIIDPIKLANYKLNNQYINLINVNYNTDKAFEKITIKSKKYIENCFEIAFKIIKRKN